MTRNVSSFYVEDKKIYHYVLDLDSEDGKSKAKFFIANGFDTRNILAFRNAICHHAANAQKQVIESNPYGDRLICDGLMRMANGNDRLIHSVWEKNASGKFRLLTAFPGRKSYLRDDAQGTIRDWIDLAECRSIFGLHSRPVEVS